MLPSLQGPKKENSENSTEHRIPIWPITHPFFAFLRAERADFDQTISLYEQRVAWLQARQCALDEDDIAGLLWKEIEQFVGLGQGEQQVRLFRPDAVEPFDLERETERIRILSGQMQTAQSGLIALALELGQRLCRVEQFFAREEENQVRQAVILRHELEWVSEALRLGHEFLPVAEVLTPEQLTVWVRSEFGLQPEQTRVLFAAAHRYPAETEVSEIAPDDRWTLAGLWLDFVLAQQTAKL